MELQELVNYLDNYLEVGSTPDFPNAHNGLQVYTPKDIQHVATAVDATLYSINEAARLGAELLLVHHGLLWNMGPLTGTFYDRIASCIKNDLGVYSSHLPLDRHPVVGNNYVLMRKLGFEPDGTWAQYNGVDLGVWTYSDVMLADLVTRVEDILGSVVKLFPFGSQHIRKFGVLSGGGGGRSDVRDAKEQGFDLLITGEGGHSAVYEMEELGINCIYAGHYLTETIGVQALGEHLQEKFGLEVLFIDHPSGL